MGSKFDEVTHGYGSDVWFVFFPISNENGVITWLDPHAQLVN